MSNAPSDGLARLQAIDWTVYDDRRIYSQVALVREHLRLMSLWCKALGCATEWPFANIASHIFPYVPASQEDINVLLRMAENNGLSRPMAKTLINYLHWTRVRETRPSATQQMPDPFEPLLLSFERGGRFYVEDGYINIGPAGVPIKDWRRYDRNEPFTSLDSLALDKRDANETLE